MIKRLLKIIIPIAIAFVLVLFLVILPATTAYSMLHPKGLSLEAEEAWEKENDLWGNFDSYEKESYEVKGKDGYILHCTLVKSPAESNRYVIISHGFNSNRYGAVKYVDAYAALDFNCIIYDLRGHGENEKTVCTIGNYEGEDLNFLIQDTYERYGNDIILGLHGESMGAATSLSALVKRPDVRFVIADCSFTNLYDLMKHGADKQHQGFMLPLVNMWSSLINGFDLKDTSPVDSIDKSTVPICFIHGTEDDLIPPEMSEDLADACDGASYIHFVPEAGHAESRKVLGTTSYSMVILSFLTNEEIIEMPENEGRI